MKFNSFDKNSLSTLRDEMQALLGKYGMQSNLQIDVGNMRFTAAEVSIKITAKVNGAVTQADSILENKVKALGLKMTNSRGEVIIEYKPRNWKMPYIYTSVDGKRYKCDEASIKRKFAA